MKQAVLLVAFGAGNIKSSSSLLNFEQELQKKYPNYIFRWAYSSHIIRARLTEQKEKSDSVLKALKKLELEKFNQVIIQSLHLIDGQEYKKLESEVCEFQKTSSMQIELKPALLTNEANIQNLAQAIISICPKLKKNQYCLFMAHGTGVGSIASNDAEQAYFQLNTHLIDKGIFVGTMKGKLNIDFYLEHFKQLEAKKIYLMPLLVVMGKHSLEDMAGDNENSWLIKIKKAGFNCQCIVNGLIEYQEITQIYLDNFQ